MSEYRIQSETLEAIGDAIRAKTGGSSLIAPEDMPSEIASISGGGSLPSGGGEDLLEKRITNTLTEYRNTKTLTTIQFAFANLTNLEHLFLPNTVLNTQCAQGCSNLLTAVIGRIGGTYALQNCSKLTIVDIALMITNSQISALAYNGCAKLETILIRNSSITALSSTNAFNGTPFASGGTGGTLYVPQALISTYQNATNWSTILGYANNQILPIEGSQYETHYADGTVIE